MLGGRLFALADLWDPSDWNLLVISGVLGASALVILIVGTLLAREADHLADRTGLGEALFGAVLLGASTSLPGVVTSVVSAFQGFPELAASNAVGGIAIQTMFLAVADMTYRRANLEHAAASIENLMQGALLCTLLAFPLAVAAAPGYTILGIHPVSLILFAVYAFGIRITSAARHTRLWRPHITRETRVDEPDDDSRSSTTMLWVRFILLGLAAATAGYVVATSGIAIIRRTGLGGTVVGALFTAVATSLPELVVAVAAVRRGALTLAVAGIIGGNTFDVLFLAFSDVAYRGGSLYHAMGSGALFLIALTIIMTGTLLLGLLRREPEGPGGIGFESVAVLVIYVTGVMVIAFT